MGKSGDNEPGFSFAKPIGVNNYKKWTREMRFSLESAGFWDHTFLDTENPKLVAIVFLGKDLKNDTKLECLEKCADKSIA